MAAPSAEKAYEKYAWIALFALGVIMLGYGFTGLLVGWKAVSPDLFAPVKEISGMTWDQIQNTSPSGAKYITAIIGAAGYLGVGFGVFTMAISARPYRKGYRWAWYVMLYIPLISAGVVAGALNGGSVIWAIILIISLVGLLLPYRKFFPKKP